MRTVRRSPLLRIVLLSLAVLFTHTARANTQLIVPVSPPCPGKVALAQPNPEKKLSLKTWRIATPAHPAYGHRLFGGSFNLPGPHTSRLLFTANPRHLATARQALAIQPQRRPFALRL